MAKPPPTPPNSDLDGVHMDRKPQNDPDNMNEQAQDEQARRAYDDKGHPKPGAESGRG